MGRMSWTGSGKIMLKWWMIFFYGNSLISPKYMAWLIIFSLSANLTLFWQSHGFVVGSDTFDHECHSTVFFVLYCYNYISLIGFMFLILFL